MDETQYDTNLGWWTDKPERESRPSSQRRATLRPKRPVEGFGVWLACALIIALVTAFVWSLKVVVGL
jgi:hypothetical protein